RRAGAAPRSSERRRPRQGSGRRDRATAAVGHRRRVRQSRRHPEAAAGGAREAPDVRVQPPEEGGAEPGVARAVGIGRSAGWLPRSDRRVLSPARKKQEVTRFPPPETPRATRAASSFTPRELFVPTLTAELLHKRRLSP